MKRLAVALALAALVGLALSLRPGGPVAAPAADAAAEVDFDFTRISATLRTAQLYRLMAAPSEFEGKTLRVSGALLTRIDPSDGKRHFGCLLDDAGGCACCSPGVVLEFEPPEAFSWPDDFPPLESPVVVTGRLAMDDPAAPRLVQTRVEG